MGLNMAADGWIASKGEWLPFTNERSGNRSTEPAVQSATEL